MMSEILTRPTSQIALSYCPARPPHLGKQHIAPISKSHSIIIYVTKESWYKAFLATYPCKPRIIGLCVNYLT